MRIKNNLQVKILIYILSTVLLVFFLVGLFVGVRNRKTAVDRAHEYAQLTAAKNASEVKSVFTYYTSFISVNSKFLSNTAETRLEELSKNMALETLQSTMIYVKWLKDILIEGCMLEKDGYLLQKWLS